MNHKEHEPNWKGRNLRKYGKFSWVDDERRSSSIGRKETLINKLVGHKNFRNNEQNQKS